MLDQDGVIMDINSVIYVPGMPTAATLTGAELLHLSRGNIDSRIDLNALAATFLNSMHAIGALINFGIKTADPNVLFPGQTWVRFNAGSSLRSANSDIDILTKIGGDQFTLSVAQMPAHSHAGSTLGIGVAGDHNHTGNTSTNGDHAHGAWTDQQGNHNHPGRYYRSNTALDGGTSHRISWVYDYGYNNDTDLIGYAGNHAHNIGMNGAGAHSHTIGTDNGNSAHTHSISGTTANTGSGSAITAVALTTHITCWLRTA
jgi:microcystin-dependent protein